MCRDTLRILRIFDVLGLNILADHYLIYLSLRYTGFASCQLGWFVGNKTEGKFIEYSSPPSCHKIYKFCHFRKCCSRARFLCSKECKIRFVLLADTKGKKGKAWLIPKINI